MSKTGFTDWLHKEIQQQRRDEMTKIIQHKGAMIVDQAQKKCILDFYTAGRAVFDEFDIRYVSAWDLKKLNDLVDDIPELFGIVPRKDKDYDGTDLPSDINFVWSDDPRAWQRKD